MYDVQYVRVLYYIYRESERRDSETEWEKERYGEKMKEGYSIQETWLRKVS